MLVTLSACDQHGASLITRLHHGRIYAASRLKGQSLACETLAFSKATLLPIVLTGARGDRNGRVQPLKCNFSTMFWMSLMASAWALGEAVGSLRGAGHSMSAWR